MKRILIVLAVVALGLGLVFWSRSGGGYVNFPPASGKTWVAFGDSLTAGFGGSDGNDYPTLLGKHLGFPILNFGTAGATSQDGLSKVDDVIRAEPRVVLLCFGGNDTLQSVPHAQTFQNLSQMIDQL